MGRTIVCDEMIDPAIDNGLEQQGFTVVRAEPSEDDTAVLEKAEEHEAPILTRDRDFARRHRNDTGHHGIIFDPGMHHRPSWDVLEAVDAMFSMMDESDREGSLIRLKRFY